MKIERTKWDEARVAIADVMDHGKPVTIDELSLEDQARCLAQRLEGNEDPLRYFFRWNGRIVNLWQLIRDVTGDPMAGRF